MVSDSKFKVGDRVKRVNEAFGRMSVGDEGIVSEAFRGSVRFDGDEHGYKADNFELVPPVVAWQPKVGDRVRYKDRALGDATVIEILEGQYAKVDTHGIFKICTERFSSLEPITEPAAPVVAQAQPALTIEAGRYYKTRDGRKVGPLSTDAWVCGPEWKFTVDHDFKSSTGKAWRADGTFSILIDREDDADLIAEWVDEPVAQPAVAAEASNDNAEPANPKFKVGDLVVTSSVNDAGVGIVREINADKTYVVDFKDTWYRVCTESEKVLSLAPVTTPAIVALIENGTAKPATRPKVHADKASATTEAERLALVFPGQQFGVFVLADSKIADVVNVPTAVLRAA